jgi:hypothetical protein
MLAGHLHGDLHRGVLCQESPSTVSLTYLQVIFMVIFTVECFAKIIAYGFWQHEEAYLRSTIFFTSKPLRNLSLKGFFIASSRCSTYFMNKHLQKTPVLLHILLYGFTASVDYFLDFIQHCFPAVPLKSNVAGLNPKLLDTVFTNTRPL